ncbi:MAG: hypothetical protein IT204_18970 [Fimbriimonadaceae bacterium]|nr:hypothetical protein [Fimbriimonadaceae bacterium]
MSSAPVGTVVWRPPAEPRARRRWAYLVLVPLLVAVLPSLLGWTAAFVGGWRVAWTAQAVPAPLALLIGVPWAYTVLGAAWDELLDVVDRGELAETLLPAFLWMQRLVLALAVLLPLSGHLAADTATRWRLAWSSGEAVQTARAVRAELLRNQVKLVPLRAVELPGTAPSNRFGGPFRAAGEPLNKWVPDDAGRLFYIADRQRRPARDLKSQLKAWKQRLAGQAGERAQALWERGLVYVPPAAPPPRTNAWGVPLARLVPLGDRWSWYLAAARPD